MLETHDLVDFSITNWYKIFKDVAMKTILLDIPPELLAKFRSDASDLEIKDSCTAEYLNQIKNVIISFPEAVAFIKTNWHAPADSKFVSFGNNLKATCVADVFLYLSASEIINSDFAIDKFHGFAIAFRPWVNIHPASEFRCIVVNNNLQGITPRDWPTYYAHFKEDGPEIIKMLTKFYKDSILGKFARKTYIFDVVVFYPESVTLLDFSPLNHKSNLYAFSWSEVQSIIAKNSDEEVAPVFRYLDRDLGIMTKADALLKFTKSMS